MEMKRVGEIMIPLNAFPHIPFWFNLRQALAALQNAEKERAAQGRVPLVILVFSAQNLLVGTVGRNEIMRGLRPGFSSAQSSEISGACLDVTSNKDLYSVFFSQERALKQLRNQVERQIVEFMAPIEFTVDYSDYVPHVIYCMIDHNLTFVPVVQDKQIVGMAYAEDVLHEVVKLLYPPQEIQKKFYGTSD